MSPAYLGRTRAIERVPCHGTHRRTASIAEGHGITLVPNHCRPCDPMVLGPFSYEVGRQFYIVASWHVCMQKQLQSCLLPGLGVFSIYREGTDREALKMA